MKLHPSDTAVLDALLEHPNGLTSNQLAAMLNITPRTARQAVYKLRLAGHRIGADRVFRAREAMRVDNAKTTG